MTLVLGLHIFLLPLSLLWKMTLDFKKKLQIAAVFFTGLLGVVSSIDALYNRVLANRSSDSTWVSMMVKAKLPSDEG